MAAQNEATMPGDRPPRPSERVNEACDRFEAAWRAGQQPRIEGYLAAADEADRHALRVELEALERELATRNRPVHNPRAHHSDRVPRHDHRAGDRPFAATARRGLGCDP